MHDPIKIEKVNAASRQGTTNVRPIGIAVLAMGGEGGGVLADWIVDMAEHEGYPAQSTSVPGVAQRTGTTVYYIEFLPQARDVHDIKKLPVLALMPVMGDVDVVICSELMETARAIQRNLVTPDKTTLIASTNRVYSMTEKTSMGDGRVDPAPFLAAARTAARRFIHGDFSSLADQAGSVISATLFGALAGSGVLPFTRDGFEAAIRRTDVGVDNSLKAFAAGFDLAQKGESAIKDEVKQPHAPEGITISELDKRSRAEFPDAPSEILAAAVRRLTDYQNANYAHQYLDRLHAIRDLDRSKGSGNWKLLQETARYLALWMSYEDTVRVAELKIRASRFERVYKEVQIQPNQILRINEYMHPRVDEIADTMPAWLGRLILRPGLLNTTLRRWTSRGRVIQTTSLSGYLMLYLVASLRSLRHRTLRHEREHNEIDNWLRLIEQYGQENYALAVEIAECQRLVKGYGETHERGMRNFKRIIAVLPKLSAGADASLWLRRLREAALQDEEGKHLEVLLRNWNSSAFMEAA